MRKFTFHKRQIWPLSLGVMFVLFFSLHKNERLMTVVWWRGIFPLEQRLAHLTALFDVSVAEVLIISALAIVFFGLTYAFRRRKVKGFLSVLLGGVLTVYAGFCLLWGTAYYAENFQDRSGLTARGGTVEELAAVTVKFAELTAEYASQVPRSEEDVFTIAPGDILAAGPRAYENAEKEFPFLAANAVSPKAFASSRALSALDFTGFYFPFTGEANINIDVPSAYLPATVCHEMTHQRGYASEQECTFLGIHAALISGDPAYAYSGAVEGYTYLSNALYRQDYDAWQRVYDTLPTEVRADLAAYRDYWVQFEGRTVQKVSNTVYDGFLKANGDHLGIRSYGTVVDLLLAYYG